MSDTIYIRRNTSIGTMALLYDSYAREAILEA